MQLRDTTKILKFWRVLVTYLGNFSVYIFHCLLELGVFSTLPFGFNFLQIKMAKKMSKIQSE